MDNEMDFIDFVGADEIENMSDEEIKEAYINFFRYEDGTEKVHIVNPDKIRDVYKIHSFIVSICEELCVSYAIKIQEKKAAYLNSLCIRLITDEFALSKEKFDFLSDMNVDMDCTPCVDPDKTMITFYIQDVFVEVI